MTPNQAFWVVGAILKFPLLPITWSWWKIRGSKSITKIALTLQTSSLVVVAATLWRNSVIGPDYSPRRYTVIWVMFVLSALTMVGGRQGRKLRTSVVLAGFVLAADWLYFAAVGSVV